MHYVCTLTLRAASEVLGVPVGTASSSMLCFTPSALGFTQMDRRDTGPTPSMPKISLIRQGADFRALSTIGFRVEGYRA